MTPFDLCDLGNDLEGQKKNVHQNFSKTGPKMDPKSAPKRNLTRNARFMTYAPVLLIVCD